MVRRIRSRSRVQKHAAESYRISLNPTLPNVLRREDYEVAPVDVSSPAKNEPNFQLFWGVEVFMWDWSHDGVSISGWMQLHCHGSITTNLCASGKGEWEYSSPHMFITFGLCEYQCILERGNRSFRVVQRKLRGHADGVDVKLQQVACRGFLHGHGVQKRKASSRPET